MLRVSMAPRSRAPNKETGAMLHACVSMPNLRFLLIGFNLIRSDMLTHHHGRGIRAVQTVDF